MTSRHDTGHAERLMLRYEIYRRVEQHDARCRKHIQHARTRTSSFVGDLRPLNLLAGLTPSLITPTRLAGPLIVHNCGKVQATQTSQRAQSTEDDTETASHE